MRALTLLIGLASLSCGDGPMIVFDAAAVADTSASTAVEITTHANDTALTTSPADTSVSVVADTHVADTATACAPPNALCDDRCTAVQDDPDHCGDCDTACDKPGSICRDGKCTCPSGKFDCADRCVSCSGTVGCGEHGPSICCDAGDTFCDTAQFGTECWPAGADCQSITLCGGEELGCGIGMTAHCSPKGNFSCCGGDTPIFCPEALDAGGFGCWDSATDCARVGHCGDQWFTCTDPSYPHPVCTPDPDCATN